MYWAIYVYHYKKYMRPATTTKPKNAVHMLVDRNYSVSDRASGKRQGTNKNKKRVPEKWKKKADSNYVHRIFISVSLLPVTLYQWKLTMSKQQFPLQQVFLVDRTFIWWRQRWRWREREQYIYIFFSSLPYEHVFVFNMDFFLSAALEYYFERGIYNTKQALHGQITVLLQIFIQNIYSLTWTEKALYLLNGFIPSHSVILFVCCCCVGI